MKTLLSFQLTEMHIGCMELVDYCTYYIEYLKYYLLHVDQVSSFISQYGHKFFEIEEKWDHAITGIF